MRHGTREGTKDQGAEDNGRSEHDDSQILGCRQGCVSKDGPQQAEGSAAGAEGEIDALPGTSRNGRQPDEDGCNDQVDLDENEVGRGAGAGEDDSRFA